MSESDLVTSIGGHRDAGGPAFPAMSIARAHDLLNQPGSMFEVEEREVRGVWLKTWKNAPPTLRDVFDLSYRFATREHLVYENERVTFAALHSAAARLAAHLARRGARPGDRIAIVMRNLPEWPVAFWAATSIGAIVTPLNAWCTGTELEFMLRHSGSRVAIADEERWQRLCARLHACPGLEAVLVTRAPGLADTRAQRLEDIIGAPVDWNDLPAIPMPRTPLEPDDDAAVFYTSGTTGSPKGAILTHRNVTSGLVNMLSVQARAYLRRGENPPAPQPNAPQKVTLLSVPFFHVTGCFAVLISRLMSGGKIVLQRRWDVDSALPLIERERVNAIGGVPTIAWQILEHPGITDYDLSSVDSIGYGGAPAPPELLRRIQERFPKVVSSNSWGMTENAAVALTNVAEDYWLRPASCGVPSPTGDAKVVDCDGRELPRGEVGELWFRGPTVARGYWQNEAATRETFVDGWLRTGDLARCDDEGFFYIVDRAKDMLIRGGENIYCVEVENALYEHPAVRDAALIALPHRTLGEEPAAVISLKPGASASEQELRDWVARRLAAFKVPVRIAFWPQTLPRNPQGKILKRELRAAFPDHFS